MTGRAERMQAIYDQVPPMADCQGNCWTSCGPASMTPWERRRLALAGHKITPDELARKAPYDFWCEALGPDGRCQAYELRPLICRIWGTVDWLPCPWGCKPVGGWLPNDVAFRLLLEITELGGYGQPVDPEAFEKLKDPAQVAALVKEMAGKGASDMARFRIYGKVLPVAITRRRPAGLPGGIRSADQRPLPAPAACPHAAVPCGAPDRGTTCHAG